MYIKDGVLRKQKLRQSLFLLRLLTRTLLSISDGVLSLGVGICIAVVCFVTEITWKRYR